MPDPGPPPPREKIDRGVIVLGVGFLIVAVVVGYVELTKDGYSSSTSSAPVTVPADTSLSSIEQRTCEIFYDIAADTSIDTTEETRLRLRDLLDGYGVSVSFEMQSALRDQVAALTDVVDTAALEAAVTRMDAACS